MIAPYAQEMGKAEIPNFVISLLWKSKILKIIARLKVFEILNVLETLAPKSLQEDYDNSGVIAGDIQRTCTGVLVSLDCTPEVVREAKEKGCNLIVSHHPILFKGLKSLTGKNYVERSIIEAIKSDIVIYAIHTNLDNVLAGVNQKISQKLGLKNTRILRRKFNLLCKLIVFGVREDIDSMSKAIFTAGGGQIGEYSECSYRSSGEGSFKPSGAANPTIGKRGIRETLAEDKLEVVVPKHLVQACVKAAKEASSYEELAFDVIPLLNQNQEVGSGMIGELEKPLGQTEFLQLLKDTFKAKMLRFSGEAKEVKTVAVCGGAGIFLLGDAMAQKADAFVTADVKYHEFFDAEDRILLADIGHFESEQFTIDLIADELKRKFPTFAVRLTSIYTNPVKYI